MTPLVLVPGMLCDARLFAPQVAWERIPRMHDPRLSQRELSEEYSSSGGAARRVPEAEQISDEAGMFRIDAPHQLGDGATQERNNSGSDQGARPDLLTEAFRGASPSPEDQVEDRFFAQVDQIRGYLTNKQKELEQREQRLLTQLAQLDQEQRSVRMWIAQSEEELNGRQEIESCLSGRAAAGRLRPKLRKNESNCCSRGQS